jgi:hypothetical protein
LGGDNIGVGRGVYLYTTADGGMERIFDFSVATIFAAFNSDTDFH